MKGYYEPVTKSIKLKHAKIYKCSHPLYSRCTLYSEGKFGLAVVQMRFSDSSKVWWWGPVDPWLVEDIYHEEHFGELFRKLSGVEENGIYPSIEVRKLMYKLGMKPMKKMYWEKGFNS